MRRPGAFQDGPDAVRIGKRVELFDPDADPGDPRIDKARRADPLGEAFAQVDMAGSGYLADRCDDLFVIDDAAPVFAGNGGCSGRCQVDRHSHPLLVLALPPADADAAHQHQAAHRDGVGVGFGKRL